MGRHDDDDDRTARQISRSKQRAAGDVSARLARTLMNLAAPALKRLALDDDLRGAIDRARAVTSPNARRRAERTLAGDLRRHDLVEVEAELAKLRDGDNAEVQQFHLAEQWRARFLAEGLAAAPDFPATVDDELPRLIDAARRERDTGRPPGAGRALFRYLTAALKDATRTTDAGADDTDDT